MKFLFIGLFLCFGLTFFAYIKLVRDRKSPSYGKKRPLSKVEQVAYWRLVQAMGDRKIVLAQVAFSSFIKVDTRSRLGFVKFNRARQKVADFVICNMDFSIYATLEVDDSSHNEEKDRNRDKILEEAGIKTFRVLATELPSAEELKIAILEDGV